MTTLGQLAERVLRKYYGGNIPAEAEVHRKEVQRDIIDACNQLLKVNSVSGNFGFSENYPDHALIANYSGVTVVALGDPEQSLVCVPIEENGIETGSPTITVTAMEVDGTDYYNVCITGITWTNTDAVSVTAFIEACDENSAIEFVGLTSTPDTFLSVGIVNLEVTSTSLCFDYFPENTPNYWATADGNGWVTGDDFLWFVSEDEDGEEYVVPTLIAEHVAATHEILAGVTTTATYGTSSFTNINCCAVGTDASDIDSEITLPAIPISMPHNEGVWRVWGTDINNPFIPARSGEISLLDRITHNSSSTVVGNKVVYEWVQWNKLRFNQPISVVGATVNLQLLIVDPNTLAETDMLPLHPDLQSQAHDMALEKLVRRLQPDKVNDDKDMRA